MESDKFGGGNEKLEFRQIVLNYLRKIMDLNLKIVNPDFKIEYVQTYRDSVLGLSDVLVPFFDEQMNKIYAKYEREYEEMLKQTTHNGMVTNIPTYKRLTKQIHRELFRELNLLLNRNDYLKSSVYGEDKNEVVREGEDDD
jgi:hypothetical protein